MAIERLRQTNESLEQQNNNFDRSKHGCGRWVFKSYAESARQARARERSPEVETLHGRKPSRTCKKLCEKLKKSCKAMHQQSRRCWTSGTRLRVLKTQTKDDEQVTQAACRYHQMLSDQSWAACMLAVETGKPESAAEGTNGQRLIRRRREELRMKKDG